jgi:hypothetical protein
MARRSRAVAVRRRRYFSRGGGGRRKTKFTLPLAVVAGFVPTAVGVWNRRSSGQQIADYLQAGFTGITPGTGHFSVANLRVGLIPVMAGFGVHMIASKLGINRAIAKAGIPLIRI